MAQAWRTMSGCPGKQTHRDSLPDCAAALSSQVSAAQERITRSLSKSCWGVVTALFLNDHDLPLGEDKQYVLQRLESQQEKIVEGKLLCCQGWVSSSAAARRLCRFPAFPDGVVCARCLSSSFRPEQSYGSLVRSEQLQYFCDLKTVEMLGKGAYGFVPGLQAGVQFCSKV